MTGEISLLVKKAIAKVLMVAIIGGVSIFVWVICCSISTSLLAERCLHAQLLVIDIVREYVEFSNGSWPRSWDDLEKIPRGKRSSLEELRTYVSIDFAADPDRMACQSSDEFNAIQPRVPCYPWRDYRELTKLLHVLSENKKNKCRSPVIGDSQNEGKETPAKEREKGRE